MICITFVRLTHLVSILAERSLRSCSPSRVPRAPAPVLWLVHHRPAVMLLIAPSPPHASSAAQELLPHHTPTSSWPWQPSMSHRLCGRARSLFAVDTIRRRMLLICLLPSPSRSPWLRLPPRVASSYSVWLSTSLSVHPPPLFFFFGGLFCCLKTSFPRVFPAQVSSVLVYPNHLIQYVSALCSASARNCFP